MEKYVIYKYCVILRFAEESLGLLRSFPFALLEGQDDGLGILSGS
jgi:hypothetical protein